MIIFYLGLQIYEKFLKSRFILIDIYYEKIGEIYFDYLNYDDKNMSLLDSVNKYINDREDYIKDMIKECVEYDTNL